MARAEGGEGHLSMVHPDDRQRIADLIPDLECCREISLEYRVILSDGEMRHVKELCKPVFDEAGAVVKVVGATQDVTDLRRQEIAIRSSEQRYREIFEESPLAVFDDDWRQVRTAVHDLPLGEGEDIAALLRRAPALCARLFRAIERTGISEAAVRLYRAESKDALDLALRTKDPDPGLMEGFAAVVAAFFGGASLCECEVDVTAFDGTPIRARFRAALPESYRNDWSRVLVVMEDITEQRKSEEQLRRSQKMDAVGQLTGGIAHDFNNILMVVDGYARHAEKAIDRGKDPRDAIAKITAASDKAASLTKQLLTFSRRQVMERRVFSVKDEIEGIDGLLRRAVSERCELRFEISDPEVCVRTDPGEFTQALLNLVINSRDAMPEGGTIVVGAGAVELDAALADSISGLTAGKYAVVSVRDQGMGMDAETVAKIFEPFFTTKAQGKGTGLGLAMVYGFAQQSGGAVTVTTAPGAGCTFAIHLPLVEQAPDRAVAEDGEAFQGKGERILLVEDEPEVLKLVKITLESLNYKVLTASSGEEALRVQADCREEIALLLSDIVMPGMDGLELAEQVKAARPGIAVLLTSGYPARDRKSELMAAYANAFLQKPVKPERLAQAIRAQLDGAGFKQDNAA